MKSLLVHLDASPRAELRLSVADRIARQQGAELVTMYGVRASALQASWAAPEALAYSAAAFADLDREQRQRARAMFERTLGAGAQGWRDGGDEPYAELYHQALLSDLVVVGQPDPKDEQTGALPPDLVPGLVIDAGRPTLLVPSAGSVHESFSTLLLAWKPTRESARALHAALPWLQRAVRIEIAAPFDLYRPGLRDGALEHWLRLQGVDCPVNWHAVSAADAGEALLSLAADCDASLLVMGCYGHSRARELVLGGASRTVLRSMTVPVLMAH